MDYFLNDSEIKALIEEEKYIAGSLNDLFKMKVKKGHKESEYIINRVDKSLFKIIIRLSNENIMDFSAILGFTPANKNLLFLLRRYNGKSHEHSNKIEKEAPFYDFHIHYATERYQKEGYKEEYYAKPTNRYSDIHGAINCLIEDCKVISNENQIEFNL